MPASWVELDPTEAHVRDATYAEVASRIRTGYTPRHAHPAQNAAINLLRLAGLPLSPHQYATTAVTTTGSSESWAPPKRHKRRSANHSGAVMRIAVMPHSWSRVLSKSVWAPNDLHLRIHSPRVHQRRRRTTLWSCRRRWRTGNRTLNRSGTSTSSLALCKKGHIVDKTELVSRVSSLMSLSDHDVQTSVLINFREIDVVAKERFGMSRKTILIECADYAKPVGIPKLQGDLEKLRAAQEQLGGSCVIMHVAANGYSQQASGYAQQHGLDALTPDALAARMVNFEGYIQYVRSDPVRKTILDEYQPTKLHHEGSKPATGIAAIDYLKNWLTGDETWLTVLGDYGVGKSWMLKRLLFDLVEDYDKDPAKNPVPILVPLQRFRKAFDLETLLTSTLQNAGVRTVNIGAFQQLASMGRVIYLFDSFDEMASTIRADVIRENLVELLGGVQQGSKAIMTSRPNYFESRAERLMVVEREGSYAWEPIDEREVRQERLISRLIEDQLSASSFARLNDLSRQQRTQLFQRVLAGRPEALKRLRDLYDRFQNLEGVSQRAVIARLLTSVAETLASGAEAKTADGIDLLPDELADINEAKIFQLVVHSLLVRDLNSGGLRASERHKFLNSLAVYLQQRDRSYFATTTEIRQLVSKIFQNQILASESQEVVRENYYRTCRRHSGLTTEGQFRDTSGAIDIPVDESDADSAVGFSHNSIREYLVAESAAFYLMHEAEFDGLLTVDVTDAVSEFFVEIAAYTPGLLDALTERYAETESDRERQFLFRLAGAQVRRDPMRGIGIFGTPPRLTNLDLASVDLSGLPLAEANFSGSLLLETDLRKSDIRGASFSDALLELVQLDETNLKGADFSTAETISIFVHDQFVKNTVAVLRGVDAQQWIFSSGGLVSDSRALNPYLGQPWYEACREMARTLAGRMAGTHEANGLVKGTRLADRSTAGKFRDFLVKLKVLEVVGRSKSSGASILKVSSSGRKSISEFAEKGVIDPSFKPFFEPLIGERISSAPGGSKSHS
jgi:hypothetical protein